MELRELQSFLAVARTGSFTAAAEHLGYTQSAVSQQVAALERAVGHRLLDRRPVRLTPAGARLAEHAAQIVLRLDVARSELGALAIEDAPLRIAATALAAPWAVARAAHRTRPSGGSLPVQLSTVARAEAVAHVANGRADVAVVGDLAAPDAPLRATPPGLLSTVLVAEVALEVAMAADHPLARRRSIDADTLRDAPWIDAPALMSLDALWGGSPPRRASAVRYDGTDVATLAALVEAGHGLAVLPAGTGERAGVRRVPLGAPALVQRVEALTLRSAPERTHAFVRALRVEAAGGEPLVQAP